MLYVIYGTDTAKARKKMQNMLTVLQSKRPDAILTRLNESNWNSGFLDETLSGMNLFAPKNIIVLDSLFAHPEAEDYIEDRLKDMGASEHVCVMIESKISKEKLKKLEKHAEKIEEHNVRDAASEGSGASASSSTKRETPKTFTLADALVSKNKVKAWTVFQELAHDEVAAEEIHGVLWWQFKSLYLTFEFKSAKEADLNPYVFSKCSGFKKNWEKKEVENFIDELVGMYHKAHRGEIDFMCELEKVCLG